MEAGKVAKSNAEVVSCKQEIDDINSQINALNDSSIDSIAKITKIYENLIQEQKINSKYESVYNIPLEKTKEILDKSKDPLHKKIKTNMNTMTENLERNDTIISKNGTTK